MDSKQILNIDNKYIYDFSTDNISIDFSLKDIKEYSKRKASFTKPISIPITKETEQIFKGAFNINSTGGYNQNATLPASIIENDIEILKGSLYLEEIYNNHYEVVIANNNLTLFQDIGDNYLSDLSFSAGTYQHTITKQHILDQWNAGDTLNGSGLTYTYIDYNDIIESIFSLAQDYSILPATAVLELFEKIISDNGYTYEMSSDLKDIIKKLVIPFNGSIDNFTTTFQFWKSHFESSGGKVSRSNSLINNLVHVDFIGGDYNNISNDTNQTSFSCPTTGTYKFKFKINGKDANEGSVDIKLFNYGTFPIDVIDIGSIDLTTTNADYEVTKDIYLSASDNIYIQFIYSDDATVIINDSSTLEISLYNYLYEEFTDIDINDVLPVNYKQKDFINDIIKLFNLYIYADDIDTKKLHIETYEEFYSDEVIDWSNKIHQPSIKFRSLNNQLSKTYNFSFTDESDIYNEDYVEQKGKGLYSNSITNPSSIVNPNSIEEIKINTTPLVEVNINDSWRVGKSLSENGKREYKPRILFSTVSDISSGDWKLFTTDVNNPDNNIIDNVLYASHFKEFDITDSTNLFLGFNADDSYIDRFGDVNHSNLTLYNKYYKQDIESALNANYKLLTAQFRLNSLDVSSLSFKKLIYINDDIIGQSYYRLNRIKNYRSSEDLVEVELIKINPYDSSYSGLSTPNIITLLPFSETAKSSVAGSSSSSGSGSGSVDLSDYYIKSETNTLLEAKADATDLNDKVSKTTGHSITAIHDFSNGLKIDNNLIDYDSGNNQIVINSSIRVEGGISATNDIMAFGSGNTNAGVFDALGSHVDNSTIYYCNGVLSGASQGAPMEHTHPITDITNFQTCLDSKSNTSHNHSGIYEPAFSKCTAFNKNLGITSGTVSEGNHTHSIYLGISNNAVSATKLVTARSIGLGGDLSGSANFDGTSNITITATVQDDSHNHIISNIDNLSTCLSNLSLNTHNHSGTYEPVFSKNTGFNKNLGTTSGTVSEGNHNHDSTYLGISNNACSASKLATARNITLAGDATGSISFDGTSNKTLTVVINDDSHNHIISNIDNLSTCLNGKANSNHTHSISCVTGLQTALDGKSSTSHNHSSIYLGISNNAVSASKLNTSRSIGLGGDLSGSANFDGTANITITATVQDDSHNHIISNVDNLSTCLSNLSLNTHTHDARYVRKDCTGANSFQGNNLIFSYNDANNIDHINYNDTDNTFYFNADTTLGNSTATGKIKANCITATGEITAYSDRRLKCDISNIGCASYLVNQLQGVQFKRKDDNTHKCQIGFIAQDLENYLPQVVNNEGDYKSVNYGAITALLVQAVKEQQKEINNLKEIIYNNG